MVDPNKFGYVVQDDEVSGCTNVIYFHTTMVNNKNKIIILVIFSSCLCCKLFFI